MGLTRCYKTDVFFYIYSYTYVVIGTGLKRCYKTDVFFYIYSYTYVVIGTGNRITVWRIVLVLTLLITSVRLFGG